MFSIILKLNLESGDPVKTYDSVTRDLPSQKSESRLIVTVSSKERGAFSQSSVIGEVVESDD